VSGPSSVPSGLGRAGRRGVSAADAAGRNAADVERDLIRVVHAEVARRLAEQAGRDGAPGSTGSSGSWSPQDRPQDRREAGWLLIGEVLEAHARAALRSGTAVPDTEAETRVARAVHDSLFGLGGFTPLLEDPGIENIDANGCDVVWVRRADGTRERVGPVASSDDDLVDLIRTLAARTGTEERRFDRGVPRLSAQLPDGSRLFAVMAVSRRPSVSIRRHRFPRTTLRELTRLGMIDRELRSFLTALVLARKNVLVAGGTNLGKTTLLRALASVIPAEERLVTIEDAYELGLDHDRTAHPNVVALQAREPNVEGAGEVTQSELVRWALRMSPDRVIVGEIRGCEVIPMCNAMSQGNDGSMTTLHASGSRGVFTKLAAYAVQAPERLPLEATNLLVASAVHVVVHLAWAGGRRVVSSVREVVDADGAHVVSNEVFRPGPDGRAVRGVPLRAETADALAAVGYEPAASAWDGGQPGQGRWGR
jgi:pilus assembly protein CpaF